MLKINLNYEIRFTLKMSEIAAIKKKTIRKCRCLTFIMCNDRKQGQETGFGLIIYTMGLSNFRRYGTNP